MVRKSRKPSKRAIPLKSWMHHKIEQINDDQITFVSKMHMQDRFRNGSIWDGLISSFWHGTSRWVCKSTLVYVTSIYTEQTVGRLAGSYTNPLSARPVLCYRSSWLSTTWMETISPYIQALISHVSCPYWHAIPRLLPILTCHLVMYWPTETSQI